MDTGFIYAPSKSIPFATRATRLEFSIYFPFMGRANVIFVFDCECALYRDKRGPGHIIATHGFSLRGWRDRGDLKAERRIISKRCMVEYIQLPIFRSSFKFCIGDKLREKMEGGKRDETFFSAL